MDSAAKQIATARENYLQHKQKQETMIFNIINVLKQNTGKMINNLIPCIPCADKITRHKRFTLNDLYVHIFGRNCDSCLVCGITGNNKFHQLTEHRKNSCSYVLAFVTKNYFEKIFNMCWSVKMGRS